MAPVNDEQVKDLVRKASSVLKKAVEYDHLDKINDAIPNYTEGITILSAVLGRIDGTHSKFAEYQKMRNEYEARVEVLKSKCQFDTIWECRKIEEMSIGHGYDKVFGKCCDGKLQNIEVHDSYIRSDSQVEQFVRFCELVVSLSKRLKTIALRTHTESKCKMMAFKRLTESLETQGITLLVDYAPTIHDREIIFDNGWTVKIGRGLDYFHPLTNSGSERNAVLGAFDLNFRPCKETTVDYMRKTEKKM